MNWPRGAGLATSAASAGSGRDLSSGNEHPDLAQVSSRPQAHTARAHDSGSAPSSTINATVPGDSSCYATDDEAPVAAPPVPRTVMAAIDALCDAIEGTAPAEVVAGLDPAALIRLARDAELGSAWLGALQVLAASAARRRGAGQGAPPIAPSEAHGSAV